MTTNDFLPVGASLCIVIAAVLLATACGGSAGRSNKEALDESDELSALPAPKDGGSTIVFVDLTGGLGSGPDNIRVQAIARGVRQLIVTTAPGTLIRVIPVDSSSAVQPILTWVVPKRPTIRKDFFVARNLVGRKAAEAEKKIIELHDKVYSKRTDVPLTCLIRSLETASAMFARSSNERETLRLFFFSDMVEECNGPAGPIFMTRDHYRPSSIEAYSPSFDTSIFNDVELHVVFSEAGPGTISQAIPTERLLDAWLGIFEKAGFDPRTIQRAWHFGGLPPAESPWSSDAL